MQHTALKIDPQGPQWLKHLIGAVLFLGIGIALYGIVISVEYRWAKVLDVTTLAGRSVHYRAVLVETPERLRVLRTSDHLVRAEKGAQVCIAKRRIISRRWLRYSIELPGYCRNQTRDVPLQSTFRID